jgi:hypothetical protein
MRTEKSLWPVAQHVPSGENATARTHPSKRSAAGVTSPTRKHSCPNPDSLLRERTADPIPDGGFCLLVAQIREVPSREQVARRRPAGENAAAQSASACPETEQSALISSHSTPPPRGGRTNLQLQYPCESCPARVRRRSPLLESRSLQVRSADTLARVEPPGETTTPIVPLLLIGGVSLPHNSAKVSASCSTTRPSRVPTASTPMAKRNFVG